VGGDVITGFDGRPMSQMEDLQTMLQASQPGKKVLLTLMRDGKETNVEVILEKRY
jgi:S1-C subfamily serine protease